MSTPAGFVQASTLTQILEEINGDADFLIGINDLAGTPKLRNYLIDAVVSSAKLLDITLTLATTALANVGVPKFVRFDPNGGPRVVTLPDPAESRQYLLLTTDTANAITVEDGTATIVGTLDTTTQALWMIYDIANTTWISIPLGGGGGSAATSEKLAVAAGITDLSVTGNDSDAILLQPSALGAQVQLSGRLGLQRLYNNNVTFDVEILDTDGLTSLGFIGGVYSNKQALCDFIVDEYIVSLL